VKLRRWAAPAAAVALLACSACGSDLTPGTASVVNGSRITEDQVTDLADAQCTAADIAAESGQSSAMAVSRVKKQSLGLLIDVELSQQFGEKEGIEPDEALAEGFYGQLEQGIAPLPGKTRTVLEDVFGEWAEGRAILVQAGSEATGEKPSLTNLEQLTNAGLTARGDVLKDTQVDTDPRYAPNEDGFPGAGDGSVSKASSDFAKSAEAEQPDAAWAGALPAGQTCG